MSKSFVIKRSHVPFSRTQVSPLSINPLHTLTTVFNLLWLSSEKFISERQGLGSLLVLQWVKDQLKLENHPIKMFYFAWFNFCSSHLSSVYLILFHIYFNFVSISFKFNFNFISIFFQFSLLFFYFFNFILLFFSVLYFILFHLILFYLLYHNLLPGQPQHLTPATTVPKRKYANLDNWEQQIF